jgi:hypothetical protein
MNHLHLPELPYDSWSNTRSTVHLILQIIGKTRLGLTTRKNHWWYITLYVSPRGFSTFNIPIDNGNGGLEIELNIFERAVVISHSDKGQVQIELQEGLSISEFYKQYMSELKNLGLNPKFVQRPFDMGLEKPFDEITEFHHFDWNSVMKFWRLMQWNNSIFQEFSGRFYGKTSPVQIFWHHLDIAVTRFSGKSLEPMDRSVRISDRDAYSHEQISFGFWIGDDNVPEPAYYSYTYPSPEGIDSKKLAPESAKWVDSNGSPMALLRFEDVRVSDDPRQTVLNFLESAYQAGANLANWNVDEWTTPALKDL